MEISITINNQQSNYFGMVRKRKGSLDGYEIQPFGPQPTSSYSTSLLYPFPPKIKISPSPLIFLFLSLLNHILYSNALVQQTPSLDIIIKLMINPFAISFFFFFTGKVIHLFLFLFFNILTLKFKFNFNQIKVKLSV